MGLPTGTIPLPLKGLIGCVEDPSFLGYGVERHSTMLASAPPLGCFCGRPVVSRLQG